MVRELSPREIVGIEVIVQPMILAKMTGTFFPTTLDLTKELTETIGLDFVEILANAEAVNVGQPAVNSLRVFYGVHVDLLRYQGKKENHHYFKGNFFCTEKRILGSDDPQARPYLENFENIKQRFPFFPDSFSRN